MNNKVLGVARLYHCGQIVEGTIFEGGLCKTDAGETMYLSTEAMMNFQTLLRRSWRNARIQQSATEVLPVRPDDEPPAAYIEDLGEYQEADFDFNVKSTPFASQTPAERPASKVIQSEHRPAEMQKQKKTYRRDKKQEKSGGEVVRHDESILRNKKTPIFIVIGIFIALSLCAAGYFMGYILNPENNASQSQQNSSSISGSASASETEPTPVTPQINLTINAVSGAEIAGSTDISATEADDSIISSSSTS